MKNIWLVDFPTYRYTQDIKSLARKAGLKIIDKKYATATHKENVAEKTPTLTLKSEFKPKEA